jgi:hypothetical protein
VTNGRWHWPRSLRRGSAAVRLLGSRVRIPLVAWMSVSCEYCVLSGRGLCVGLITRPEESYRLWCVSECDREAWIMRRPWPTGGCCALGKRKDQRMLLVSVYKLRVVLNTVGCITWQRCTTFCLTFRVEDAEIWNLHEHLRGVTC